jgi:ferredoxin
MSDARFRVSVDPEKCQGHNRCYSLAPELFDVDDFGMASARGDGLVAPDLEEKARRAAGNCPEYAITVTEVTEEVS